MRVLCKLFFERSEAGVQLLAGPLFFLAETQRTQSWVGNCVLFPAEAAWLTMEY